MLHSQLEELTSELKSLIWDKLRETRDNGLAVLLISADLEELIGLSDRIIVFYQGKFVKELRFRNITPEDLGGLYDWIKKMNLDKN